MRRKNPTIKMKYGFGMPPRFTGGALAFALLSKIILDDKRKPEFVTRPSPSSLSFESSSKSVVSIIVSYCQVSPALSGPSGLCVSRHALIIQTACTHKQCRQCSVGLLPRPSCLLPPRVAEFPAVRGHLCPTFHPLKFLTLDV